MFEWYDFWIGFFWDSRNNRLYIFPLPTLGVRLSFKRKCTNCGKRKWEHEMNAGACLEHWQNGEIGN